MIPQEIKANDYTESKNHDRHILKRESKAWIGHKLVRTKKFYGEEEFFERTKQLIGSVSMHTFSLINISEITFDSGMDHLEMNIREVQSQGFYIEKLFQAVDRKVKVVARRCFEGMEPQTYEMLDVPGIFKKWEDDREKARNEKYVW